MADKSTQSTKKNVKINLKKEGAPGRNENFLKTILSLLSMLFLIYIGSHTLKWIKVDITEEKLYTISSGTKSILQKLDTPIKLKLYYSKIAANKGSEGLRNFNNHFHYVHELLKEYLRHSRNNLQLQVIDPRPDTPEEEDAMAYGLNQFQLTDTEKYFFGLVAENESGTEKIIEFFNPNEKDRVEYDLTKLIYTIQNPKKKTIGILSSLDVMADKDLSPYMAQIMRMQGQATQESWIITRLLKDLYEIKKIPKETESIASVDSLAIIHPKGFSEKTLFAIDQYLMRGGNLIVLVDPHAVVDTTSQQSLDGGSPDKGFQKLMDKWGVEAPSHMFAGDKYLSGVGQVSRRQRPQRLLALLSCNDKCSSSFKDPISSSLNSLSFIYPGVLRTKELEGLTVTPILSTSDKGNSYTAHIHELNNPSRLWKNFSDGNKPVIIAQKILGKFKTAFPKGLENEEKGKKKKKAKNQEAPPKEELIQESQKESAIIVFADVDFIADPFAFKQSFFGTALANNNSTLLLNAIEALSGDVNLMSVRSKVRINRSFDVIENIEFAAEKKTEDKVKEINANIARVQAELNQLGKQANEGNIAILQNEGLKKQKKLAKHIALMKKELRSVKREGREKIETIGTIFLYINTLLGPLLVILGGLWYSRKRRKKMASPQEAPQKLATPSSDLRNMETIGDKA